MMLSFWGLGVGLWLGVGLRFYIFNFGFIGTALGLGLGAYMLLPRSSKPRGRKLAQFLVGCYMLGFLGLFGHENMQLEGFFFYLLRGRFRGAVIHYLVAKIFGPLLFGRGWCGWACWTAMLLDLLPWARKVPGAGASPAQHLRLAMLLASLGLVLALWFGVGYSGSDELAWLLVGNGLYFGAAFALALARRDNRAFCKILCPIAIPMKLSAGFALLKIGRRRGAPDCTGCGSCAMVCPMGIAVDAYAQAGLRVRSTECILCLTCTNHCPQNHLAIGLGLDGPHRIAPRAP
jgi:polyferredoxin